MSKKKNTKNIASRYVFKLKVLRVEISFYENLASKEG